ncbi:sterol desaturase family protein [Spartinivicinus poritis]|uniref:Sterol desaturase family protein n=1 Tax=Spartinivicinus poritis TaxID=2994640 RepID=A0ABT5U4V0_9GAMM|nr:sterol desaturase family protein [Spartinivicinus sp. A2-2]MDE1461394.1 sterol desaturase family protein [Spartinivicinus sp. A2-2]
MIGLDIVSTSRLLIFLVAIALLGYFEYRYPYRVVKNKWTHLLSNFALIGIATVILRVLFKVLLPLSVAIVTVNNNWGAIHWLGLSELTDNVVMMIGWVIMLDCAIYWQHRLMHKLPILWRFHKIHHADRAFDFSTGVRFHPVEMIISTLFKSLLIVLLGIPVIAVIIFEILLSTSSLFEHANFRLPTRVDLLLRKILVTPSMHRIHHSVVVTETNSNFGFSLSWWDYLFGTYRDKPVTNEAVMPLGLTQYQHSDTSSISWMMIQPFKRS